MKKGNKKEMQGHAAWLAATLPDDKVVAASYWPDDEHWVFDPWASRVGANNIHNHCHTTWARSIMLNKREGKLTNPAIFDWKGKTIYIVGRGKSLSDNIEALNRRSGDEIAVFMNQSFLAEGIEFKEQDFVCCMDSNVLKTVPADAAKGKKLIACVTVCPELIGYDWEAVYGFTLWPSAPLNDLMRDEFPCLPQVNECLGIAVSAMHLAAMNGAARIVLVGQDCTSDNGEVAIPLDGKVVRAENYYMQLAQAMGCMAYFIHKRTGCEIINTSTDKLVGFNVINQSHGFMPWIQFDTLDNVVSGARGHNG